MHVSAQVDLFAAVAFHDSADTDLAAVGFNTANPLDHLTFSKHFQFRKKVTDMEKNIGLAIRAWS